MGAVCDCYGSISSVGSYYFLGNADFGMKGRLSIELNFKIHITKGGIPNLCLVKPKRQNKNSYYVNQVTNNRKNLNIFYTFMMKLISYCGRMFDELLYQYLF